MSVRDSDLFTPLEMPGEFWLTGLPPKRVPGTLQFTPGEWIELKLGGFLGPRPGLGKHSMWPLVLGELGDGTLCSLLRAVEGSTQFNVGSGVGSSQVTAQQCLLGCHLRSGGSTAFRSADVEYDCLTAWMGRSPFGTKSEMSEAEDWHYSVEYVEPPPVRYSLRDLGLTLTVNARFRASHERVGEHMLQHREGLSLRPTHSQPLGWYLDRAAETRNLLSLLVTQPVHLTRMQLQYGSHRFDAGGRMRMRKDWATVLIRQTPAGNQVQPLHPKLVPFRYEVMRDALPEVLRRWFGSYDRLKPIYDLFFLPRYNQHLPIEQQFLSLVQALEGFHRKTGHGSYIAKRKYKEIDEFLVGCIPASAPADLRAALASRLRYGNEYSLRKRLTRMIGTLAPESRVLIDPNVSGFISKVVDTRNYLTHLDGELKGRSMSVPEMIEVSCSLNALLMLLVFVRIGVPEDLARDAMRRSSQFERPRVI